MTRCVVLMCVAGCLLHAVAAGVAGAETLRWINPGGGSFDNPANWDLGRAPMAHDVVRFELEGAYGVTLPAGGVVGGLDGLEVLAGSVTFVGGNVGVGCCGGKVQIGNGVTPVAVVIDGVDISTVAMMEMTNQSMLVVRGEGSLWTGSYAAVPQGAMVRVESGWASPQHLRMEGGQAEVVGGFLNGESVTMLPGSSVVARGATARFTCENGMTLAGTVRLEDGARLGRLGGGSAPYVALLGCEMVVTGGAGAMFDRVNTDAGSSVLVGAGSEWSAMSGCVYRGLFEAREGAVTRIDGEFFEAPELDQAGVNTLGGGVTLRAGLVCTIDGLAEAPAPVARRSASMYALSTVEGPLTVRVRNGNGLRVGDVIPVFEANADAAGQFSGLVAPALGGGRVLEMVVAGGVTSARVVAGSPSCYLDADFNGDGDAGTDQDVEAFFACVGGTCCASCASADFNGDGDAGTDQDVEAFFRVLGGQAC